MIGSCRALGKVLPCRVRRSRWRLAMQLCRGVVVLECFPCLGSCGRAGEGWIPPRIVKDMRGADFRPPRRTPLRNLADNRLGPQHIFIVLCNHNNSSFAKCLSRCGRGNGSPYWALSRCHKRPRRPEDWPPYCDTGKAAPLRGVEDAAPYNPCRKPSGHPVGAGHTRPATYRQIPFTVNP